MGHKRKKTLKKQLRLAIHCARHSVSPFFCHNNVHVTKHEFILERQAVHSKRNCRRGCMLQACVPGMLLFKIITELVVCDDVQMLASAQTDFVTLVSADSFRS